MTTETLSDKIQRDYGDICEDDFYFIPLKDVREFIKQLKEKILNSQSIFGPDLVTHGSVIKSIDELTGKELCDG